MNGQIGTSPVSGDVRIDTSETVPNIDAALSVADSSLVTLLAPAVTRAKVEKRRRGRARRKSQRPYWSEQSFDTDFLTNVSGHLDLRADTLELSSALSLQKAQLVADLKDGTLEIKTLKGTLFDGGFDANAKLVKRGANLALVGRVITKSLSLARITQRADQAALAEGDVDVTLSIAGEGLTPSGLVAGLSGEGEIALADGALHAMSPCGAENIHE